MMLRIIPFVNLINSNFYSYTSAIITGKVVFKMSGVKHIRTLQGGQLWIKMGVKSKTIHSLSQALGTGVVFLELLLMEYTA